MFNSSTVSVNFQKYGIKTENESKNFFRGGAVLANHGDIEKIEVDVTCCRLPYDYAKTFSPDESMLVDLKCDFSINGALSRVSFNPFWTLPKFEKNPTKFYADTQNILIDTGNGYVSVLPLCGGDFITCIGPSESDDTLRLCVSKHHYGSNTLKGTIAIAAYANNPYDAVRKAYKYAWREGYIKTNPNEPKTLPDFLEGIGWCTWNACYHDVSEKKIFAKMDEFRQKNIQVKWIVIDDGWFEISKNDNFKISSIFEDKNKFPNGLRSCIEILKSKYGLSYVGVWHSMTAYWYGVEKDSPLFSDVSAELTQTDSDWYIPVGEDAYTFFNRWHKYLRNQGVDFLKIDTQGNVFEFLRGRKGCPGDCISTHLAVERSANEVFGGRVINCMAAQNINLHFHPYTQVVRSSDDFYPNVPESFSQHIIQNIYNSVFLSDLFCCDFDMWWTHNSVVEPSFILRLMSGGPVYVSDELGMTEEKYLKEFDRIKKCNNVARPARKYLFSNPEGGLFEIENNICGQAVLAVFNLSDKMLEYKAPKNSTVYLNGSKIAASDNSKIMLGSFCTALITL